MVLKLNFCSDFEHKVGQDFEVEVQARFGSWRLFIILSLMFCRGYEVESWSKLNMASHLGEATQDFGTRTNAYKKHQDSRLSIIIINSSSGLSRDL